MSATGSDDRDVSDGAEGLMDADGAEDNRAARGENARGCDVRLPSAP